MTTQAQVIPKFGEQTKAFSINELKRLIVAAKSMSDLDQAKRYLCSYFIPCADPHGVFWWDPDSKSLKHVIDKNIGKLIRPIMKVFYTQPEQGPSQKTEFNIYKWFMVENTDVLYHQVVTSDIMEIHEKYKTPTHYKNFMSTIVLTNENALRVDNDDRRTVFLDVSPSRKGDLNYFKKLGDAMKYPGASEAFYAYFESHCEYLLRLQWKSATMTTSKQEHIISTLPPLFQFIKDTYLIVKNYMTDLPVQEFNRVYTSYCETRGINTLSKINASRILSNELSINSNRTYINKS
ncbi:hypothetical protein GLOIN_2v1880406 [Rhizophagus irregularis DAOM 181602=DAOM 197198]|nr:hypothetical protein GLOIN_2v1880406 [Rhizophagus irregularis DAOM 181602=DAOM 197198]